MCCLCNSICECTLKWLLLCSVAVVYWTTHHTPHRIHLFYSCSVKHINSSLHTDCWLASKSLNESWSFCIHTFTKTEVTLCTECNHRVVQCCHTVEFSGGESGGIVYLNDLLWFIFFITYYLWWFIKHQLNKKLNNVLQTAERKQHPLRSVFLTHPIRNTCAILWPITWRLGQDDKGITENQCQMLIHSLSISLEIITLSTNCPL